MARSVAKKEENVPATIGFDFTNDVGAGMEGTDAQSFAIPFLKVLQKSSPEVDEASGVAIESAKAGMLYNTVSGELYDGKEGCVFIPAAYQRRFLRWSPRGSGAQGFRGELLPEIVAKEREHGVVVEHNGRLYYPMEDGTVDDERCDRLQDTRNHFGCVIDHEGRPHNVLLSLTSTQIKKSKLLMAMLAGQRREVNGAMVQPPTFLFAMRIRTVPESNDKGTWFGVDFKMDGEVTDPFVYHAAREFHEAVSAGEAKVQYTEDAVSGNAGDNDTF